tara:strand:- start:1309 stop:2175 length:867 start_codon:yes stop_codon:yes gene_type:complete
MKKLFRQLVVILLIAPVCLFATDGDSDTENAAGVVFITGSLKIDDKGIYLASTDCRYSGNYYLGGILPENDPDASKKQNKANKKANKKVAKNVAKHTKKVKKAENATIANQEIKGTINEKTMMISPLKVISPMFEPILTGLSPACDLTLTAIYALYLETERIKTETRVVTYKLMPSDDPDDENYMFWDKNCKEIGMDQLAAMTPEIKNVLKQANIAVVANIAAVGIVLANVDKIKEEINNADMLGKAAGLASLAQATAFQVRLLNDNKRLRDRIKECQDILDGFGFGE